MSVTRETTRKPSRKKATSTAAPLRFFTKEGAHPFDEISWRKTQIRVNAPGGPIEREVEVPEFWSDSAAQIAGSKYFRGKIGSPEWESSAREMIRRVVDTLRAWGIHSGYLSEAEGDVFADELSYILVHQRAAFNSPVWFNVGCEAEPQCSACFILSVEDTMESILDWMKIEGTIFKRGSGAGVNLSTLRSSKEKLSKGGHSSGPVSFMRGADSVAGMIASGGATRRAAKMVVLNVDHPDIMKFIRAKGEEEKKIRALIEAGYDMYDLNHEAWNSIQYQNANNSVRVTDEFMRAVEDDAAFATQAVTTGEAVDTHRAKDLMREIAQAAWECGDPGMQFHTTINKWHTCPASGPINASNPCSEYMHLDNSACNLASINLLRCLREDGTFATDAFVHTVETMILAQEIIVDHSSYPTEKIKKNANSFRQLGLGYANLGALLMCLGVPYDSEEARHTAAAITALMTGVAYRHSGLIAKTKKPFAGFKENQHHVLRVLNMHRDALSQVREERVFDRNIVAAARSVWEEAAGNARRFGVRNSQVTVLAPTGTIAFMMDCATTGIEPEFALVKTKYLVGGGTMRIVNTAIPLALEKLGYSKEKREEIIAHMESSGTAEGAPHLLPQHLAVFDCAAKPERGTRTISWEGHVLMVAAVQPFLSGAVSKTFNMPNDATVEDIMKAYLMGWRMGLKAFAVYRDGSKAAQPLQTGARRGGRTSGSDAPLRRRLPATRASETHKFSIAGHEGYLTYSMFENGDLAEIFVRMSKQGSILAGLLDAFAIAISIALQYGVPLAKLVPKFAHSRFEPAGFTSNKDILVATSITDYMFRYLAMRFLPSEELADVGVSFSRAEHAPDVPAPQAILEKGGSVSKSREATDAGTICRACGGMMVQTGSCKTCIECGGSNGGC